MISISTSRNNDIDNKYIISFFSWQNIEFNPASECVLKEALCSKYGFWSDELRRCFVPDNIDNITLPTLDPSVIESLEGLNLTGVDLSDPEGVLAILEEIGQTDPESINLGILESILENFDPCFLERINQTAFEDADLPSMGPAEILELLRSLVSNITLPDQPDGTNFSYPGERKIFYGPPGNFSEGVAKHVADVLRLGHHGGC